MNTSPRFPFLAAALRSLLLLACLPLQAFGQVQQAAYVDSLQNGWQDYGWAKLDFASTAQTHSGTHSIAVTSDAFAALYLHHDALPPGRFTNLTFWIHGGISGGQLLQVQATVNGAPLPPKPLPALLKQWQEVSLPFSALGITAQSAIDGFWIQDRSGKSQPTFFVDDIVFSGPTNTPPSVTIIAVNPSRNRHPIAPEVYGVAFASTAGLRDLNSPLNRSGGNTETRYNWQLNAHNHAADFYFESIADTGATPGQATDSFIAGTREGGAAPMVTVPLIGWAAKLGPSRGKLASFSIKKYGAQTANDSAYFPDAGNGIKSAGPPIVYVTNNDPNDANLPTDIGFQGGWLDHLIQQWGRSSSGGVRYYLLDNEPSLWHSTHRDIHPIGATLQEIRDRTLDYAAMIKAHDSGAMVFGPEEWGWSGYLYSGYDQQYTAAHGYSSFPDRAAHGNQDAIPWLLDQWREADAKSGRRSIDVLTVHFYPQGGEFSEDVSSSMQLRRNRSTRALWDPGYRDETWINTPVRLVPRLKEWVAAHYPGTKIGLTEYNWGAEKHISGAIAQADILGILGREGIDFANRWTAPASHTPVSNAFRLLRNYDGQGAGFGDLSVEATAADPDTVAAFASLRTPSQNLTVLLLNKDPATTRPVRVEVSNFDASGGVELWRLDASNSISRLADGSISAGVFEANLPAQSLTLLVIPARTLKLKIRADLDPNSGNAKSGIRIETEGRAGDSLRLDGSLDLRTWSPLLTNLLSGTLVEWVLSEGATPFRFFRATAFP